MNHRRQALRRWLVRSCPLLQRGGAVVYLPLLDQFSDTDGVNLAEHAIAPNNPGRLGWVNVNTSPITILSNQARASGTYAYYALDPGAADLLFSCKITPGTATTGYLGLLARFLDLTHFWKCAININDGFRIVELNESEIVRANASPAIEQGVEYTLSVTLDGAVITATLDGTTQISYSAATLNQSCTKHGLLLRFAGDLADNFQMEALT